LYIYLSIYIITTQIDKQGATESGFDNTVLFFVVPSFFFYAYILAVAFHAIVGKPSTKNTTTAEIIIIIAIGIATTVVMVMIPTSLPAARAQHGNTTEQQSVELRVQNTSMSVPAPTAKLNNQSLPHQIVVALPL
jgi:hypothetical protein